MRRRSNAPMSANTAALRHYRLAGWRAAAPRAPRWRGAPTVNRLRAARAGKPVAGFAQFDRFGSIFYSLTWRCAYLTTREDTLTRSPQPDRQLELPLCREVHPGWLVLPALARPSLDSAWQLLRLRLPHPPAPARMPPRRLRLVRVP